MKRQRAGDVVEHAVRRLRADASPLSEEFKAWARDQAAYDLELQAHCLFMKDAPQVAWDALCAEYRETRFYALALWPRPQLTQGAING